MVEAVLNIFAAFGSIWFAGKGEPERDCTQGFPLLEKVGVQEIAVRCMAAVEEKCRR
jgi:hypothetical protein